MNIPHYGGTLRSSLGSSEISLFIIQQEEVIHPVAIEYLQTKLVGKIILHFVNSSTICCRMMNNRNNYSTCLNLI